MKNRVIKFRAWDNVKDEMYYTGEEDLIVFIFTAFGIIGDEIIPDDSVEGFHAERLEHLQYMQFTGLHDKNGVEIYEDDIYKTPSGKIGQVFFHADGGWLVETKEREYVLRRINSRGKGEVIGNIHQHPHLLEGS